MTEEEEKELRNQISDLQIRNLELVKQLQYQHRELSNRFSDDDIARIIKMVDSLKDSGDYY